VILADRWLLAAAMGLCDAAISPRLDQVSMSSKESDIL
jgi:hypothetical protein